MDTRHLLGTSVTRRVQPNSARPRARRRAWLAIEALEERAVPTIDVTVAAGGTLDINPVSSIFPSAGYARMEVLTTTVPGLDHGTMYRVDRQTRIRGVPGRRTHSPATAPSFNENRIFAGEGFRYVNDGTGLGLTESIPVRFSDSTGSTTATDTLVIHITSPAGMPAITTQPVGTLDQ